jgi:hypothetical protein
LKEIFSNSSLADPFPHHHSKNHDYYNAWIHIYTEDTMSLWKVPEIQTWIKSVVETVDEIDLLNDSSSFEPMKYQIRNLQRVIVLREIRALYRFLPPNGMDNLMAFDPLPPIEDAEQSIITNGVNTIYRYLFGA